MGTAELMKKRVEDKFRYRRSVVDKCTLRQQHSSPAISFGKRRTYLWSLYIWDSLPEEVFKSG